MKAMAAEHGWAATITLQAAACPVDQSNSMGGSRWCYQAMVAWPGSGGVAAAMAEWEPTIEEKEFVGGEEK